MPCEPHSQGRLPLPACECLALVLRVACGLLTPALKPLAAPDRNPSSQRPATHAAGLRRMPPACGRPVCAPWSDKSSVASFNDVITLEAVNWWIMFETVCVWARDISSKAHCMWLLTVTCPVNAQHPCSQASDPDGALRRAWTGGTPLHSLLAKLHCQTQVTTSRCQCAPELGSFLASHPLSFYALAFLPTFEPCRRVCNSQQ